MDSTLRCEMPNDLCEIWQRFPSIKAVALNGATAHKLFHKHFVKTKLLPQVIEVLKLTSSSPAKLVLLTPNDIYSHYIVDHHTLLCAVLCLLVQ